MKASATYYRVLAKRASGKKEVYCLEEDGFFTTFEKDKATEFESVNDAQVAANFLSGVLVNLDWKVVQV